MTTAATTQSAIHHYLRRNGRRTRGGGIDDHLQSVENSIVQGASNGATAAANLARQLISQYGAQAAAELWKQAFIHFSGVDRTTLANVEAASSQGNGILTGVNWGQRFPGMPPPIISRPPAPSPESW